MTKALIFLDGPTCKVVFGNALKCFKVSDSSKPEIEKFLSKIFSNYDVRVATATVKTDKDSFLEAIGRASGATTIPSSAVANAPIMQPPPQQQRQARRAPPQPHPSQAPALAKAPDFANINWLKSNAAVTICIDELQTNEEVRPGTGIKKSFIISPGCPANLAGIDPQKVRQSMTLANLLRNGTLVPISQAEAFHLQNEHDKQVQEENDARLEAESPIVDRHDVMENGMNTQGHDAPAIDLTNEADALTQGGMYANEGQGTMTELMGQIYEQETASSEDAEIVEITDIETATLAQQRPAKPLPERGRIKRKSQ